MYSKICVIQCYNNTYAFFFKSLCSGGIQTGCMDLSSGPRTLPTSVNIVQDFSMPFKNKSSPNVISTPSSTPPKSKLDDMLNKLMQKKNCVRTSRVSVVPLFHIVFVFST